MKGLELSKSFYIEYGKDMIRDKFPYIENRLAFGLIGSGSECFSFDDDISKDHDFDPGFIIFVPDDLDEKTVFNLKREYAKLPMEYKGYKREVMSPVGGNRRGVKKVSDFLLEKTGTVDGNLSYYDFIVVPEESLAELTNGEIWRDDSKIITDVRLKLMVQPNDVMLKKLAGELLIMAQSGQYNYKRCILHGESGAAKLSLYEFVNATIHAIFLLNEVYMPYYKWKFKALRNLYWPNDINMEERLMYFLNLSEDMLKNVERIVNDIDDIAKIFIKRLNEYNLSDRKDVFLESHAYEVNNKIKDIDLRNRNILVAVKE